MERTNELLGELDQAIARDDDEAGWRAALALAAIVLGDLSRIADALEHIGRNLPSDDARARLTSRQPAPNFG